MEKMAPKKYVAGSDSETDLLACESRRESGRAPSPPAAAPKFKSSSAAQTPKAGSSRQATGDQGWVGSRQPKKETSPTRLAALPLTPVVVSRPTRIPPTAVMPAFPTQALATKASSRSPAPHGTGGPAVRSLAGSTRLVATGVGRSQEMAASRGEQEAPQLMQTSSVPLLGFGGSASAVPGGPEEGPPRHDMSQYVPVPAGYIGATTQGARTHPTMGMTRMFSSPGQLVGVPTYGGALAAPTSSPAPAGSLPSNLSRAPFPFYAR